MARRENRERTSTLEASIRMGARNDGMRNICELFFKRRYLRQAKDADRPGPKWQEVWMGCSCVASRNL